jgi:hypothetical protein
MNRHILDYGHLASLVWAMLIPGRFRDVMLPNFYRYLLVQMIPDCVFH